MKPRYTVIDKQGNVQNCPTRKQAIAIAENLGWALVFDNQPKFGRANQFFCSHGRWEAEIDIWEIAGEIY